MTVAITRMDLDAAVLRAEAVRCKDVMVSRRLLALALVLDGHGRAAAAQAAGMDRQTLRDWVHRYNEAGLQGLRNRPNTGAPPRKLSGEQEAAIGTWVWEGPSLAEHKVIRWRLIDVRDEIARKFKVELHERTVGKLLRRLAFSRISVRLRHLDQDGAAQEAHTKTLPTWSLPPSPTAPAASRSSSGGRMKRASASKAA